MIYLFRSRGWKAATFILFILISTMSCRCRAQDWFVGENAGAAVFTGAEDIYLAETFVGRRLPWRPRIYSSIYLQPDLGVSAGWLTEGHVDGFIGKVEPIVELHFGQCPVYLEGGFSPTFMSRHIYGAKNLGGDVLFTSHIAVDWDMTKCFTLGLRLSHTSNGGLYRPNPGVNFVTLTLSYHF